MAESEIPNFNPETNLLQLIETVYHQGCVRLKGGEDGIPRKIEITPDGAFIFVDCAHSKHEIPIEDIAEIVFVG